ncbi:hypothetical protein [Mucilaginibacter sp.]|uniref:hypothetical protein n=1 Tax=Mucilaginibacter sp. TaxID=1882438 RepID=UPI00283C129F|nr:hypothetical protein [Mucilaginibacter sp.]MDR3696833.1 hypothetical protein [Mucilaginibacter sp.]
MKNGINIFKKLLNNIDGKLLLFLILFLNVKLAVKIPAIIIIYLLQFNFSFGFSLKNSRLPLFYLLIIGVAFIGLLANHHFTEPGYLPLFFTGIFFWGLCILAVHQVKLSVENNDTEVIHRTILVFFLINALISFYNIGLIMWQAGTINPYTYQGEYQKYFIGTGDYILGLTFDISTTNAVLNALGVIYFLDREKPLMVLTCMAVLLLTGSNFTNIILIAILAFLFIFKSSKDQKSIIVICLMFLVVFMAKVSPQNNKYTGDTIANIIHPQKPLPATIAKIQVVAPGPDEIKRKIAQRYLDSLRRGSNKSTVPTPTPKAILPKTENGRILIAGPDINTPPYQTPTDTTPEQGTLLTFIDTHKAYLALSSESDFIQGAPGKVISQLQTIKFLERHPVKIIAGDGIGNFSSKLAFKATGLGFAGGWPEKYRYISKDFLLNHLDVYLNFFSKRTGFHSLTNSPYSVYDQLLGEYGLLGMTAFLIFYVWFFARHYKRLTYGIPLLILMLAVFSIDYWFEQLSVVVFFELLLFLNIKETTKIVGYVQG